MVRFILALTMAVGVWPTASAQAAPIFLETFNLENGGSGQLNYGSFSNFSVADGVVDLIGNDFWDFTPGNGLYVDLDGSANNAGVLTGKKVDLGPGVYRLSFDLGGSHRGTTEDVNITIFGGNNPHYASHDITKFSLDPLAPVYIQFALFSPDAIQFAFSNSGYDNIGALLDNVQLDQLGDTSAVPEPGSLLLFGTGAILAGRRLRRSRKASQHAR